MFQANLGFRFKIDKLQEYSIELIFVLVFGLPELFFFFFVKKGNKIEGK